MRKKEVAYYENYTSIRYTEKPYLLDVREDTRDGEKSYVVRTICRDCGKEMSEVYSEEEYKDHSLGQMKKKCSCGSAVCLPYKKGSGVRVSKKKPLVDENVFWRARAWDNERIKYNTPYVQYVNLFHEKYDKVTAVIGYGMYYVKETGKLGVISAAAKIIMNMKTGMTYIKNYGNRGKEYPELMRLFYKNGLKTICYGLPEMFCGGILKRVYCHRIIRVLEEPEVLRHFAEHLVRHGKVKKEMLTKKGDYSDTTFPHLCIANNAPLYTYRGYAIMRNVWWNKSLQKVKAFAQKGPGYLKEKCDDIPNPLKRIVVKDPVLYFVYKSMTEAGFTDLSLIRNVMQNMTPEIAATVITAMDSSKRFYDYGFYKDSKNIAFMKEYIRIKGEEKAITLLLSASREERGYYYFMSVASELDRMSAAGEEITEYLNCESVYGIWSNIIGRPAKPHKSEVADKPA